MKMKKLLGFMLVLVCFTGCAKKEINYDEPSSIKEDDYAHICRLGRG